MLTISAADRLFILTGAGVSAESGIPTFRGVGGLWRNYRIEEVASPQAWRRDRRLVWEFYSMRRRVASTANSRERPLSSRRPATSGQNVQKSSLCARHVVNEEVQVLRGP